MPTRDYDVVVVGAGPAGTTAATLLRRQGHRVALVDRAKSPRPFHGIGWLNARAVPLLTKFGIPLHPLLDGGFRDVDLYSADLTKHIKPALAEPPGFVIDRAEFENALVKNAVSAGVSAYDGKTVKNIQLKESSVIVQLESAKQLEGRFLALSAGRGTRLLERVGVSADPRSPPIWCAQVDAPWPEGVPAGNPSVAILLGLDKQASFGILCKTSTRFSVGVNILEDQAAVIPALVRLCRLAVERGLVPRDLSATAANAEILFSPASGALDMETHVAKHTLVMGDAGGFVAAASNEGLYPAMWSAKIAAEVFDRALQADVRGSPSQDELMQFDSLWRVEMADYLRSPHTDIQFLLPLIFSNQAMAARMAAAFFSGENI